MFAAELRLTSLKYGSWLFSDRNAVDPSYAPALHALARALRQLDPQQAQQLLKRLSEEQTDRRRLDQISLLGNQANQEMAADRFEAAIQHFHEALNLCEQCALAGALHKNLGLAYCRNGVWIWVEGSCTWPPPFLRMTPIFQRRSRSQNGIDGRDPACKGIHVR